MDELRVGVIGCGRHAQSHFGMIAAEPRVRLVAIAELDDGRRAEAEDIWSVPGYSDYRAMLDEHDLDIVHVVTMPAHLKAIVLDCLQRDINVSVEKSPGMNSEETQDMADAEAASGARAIVSLNRRYLPEVLAVRRLAREHGGTVNCSAVYNKALSATMERFDTLLPPPIISDAIHHVDLLRWFAGPSEDRAAVPTEVYSVVADGPRPVEHRQNAVIRFDTGAIGSIESQYGVGGRIQRAEIHAQDFSAYLDLTKREKKVEMYRSTPDIQPRMVGAQMDEPLDLEAVGGPGFNEVRHFVDCILEDRTPWSNLNDVVITMKLCEAIRSGHTGTLEL
ncbi:MAG: Gfo/Idh/MocA family oxidoreductase [Chloroflexota bacterium]|nr:Gfo/Idh/MocA family oxidoreductase [Chloroflexota bacterium]